MDDQFRESYEKVIQKLEGWLDGLLTNLPNFLVALIAFGIAYALAVGVRRLIERRLAPNVRDDSLRSLVATIVSASIMVLGLLVALSVMNLDTVLHSMLAGAGVAGIAIGLALQSSLANTFAGVYLAVQKVINVGDWVETNGYEGTVHQLNLRNTVLLASDNNLVMLPNKMVIENAFKNFSLSDRVRASIRCGVAYGTDLRRAAKVARHAMEEAFPQLEGEGVELHFLEFGASSVDFQLRFWIDARQKLALLEARSEAIQLLHETFEREDIEIPFPQQVLRFPSVAKPDAETDAEARAAE